MGTISKPFTFSAGATIIASEHNDNFDTVYNLVNGNLEDVNIKAGAAIAAAKLNLASIVQDIAFTGTLDFSGATITAQTTFADLVATTADINGGTIDGATLGGASQVTITDADVNGGTIDGVTLGGAVQVTITDADMNGGTVNGISSLGLSTGTDIDEISIDDTLSGDSDNAVPTEQAVKGYVDSLFNASAGDLLSIYADTEESNAGGAGAYVKVKEIAVGRPGTYRIKFDLKRNSGSGDGVDGRIYRGGVAVGTVRNTSSGTYTTYSEDLSGWSAGDLCQLYVNDGGAGSDVAGWRNFRIYEAAPIAGVVIDD